jgi:hypothetical protein
MRRACSGRPRARPNRASGHEPGSRCSTAIAIIADFTGQSSKVAKRGRSEQSEWGGEPRYMSEIVVGQLRRNAPWCQNTSTARSFSAQHVVTQVPVVRRNHREMILTAAGAEIHRPADVRGNLRCAYRVESHHQLDRNIRSAEFCGHRNSGAAAQRMTDDHDGAQPAGLVLPDRVPRKRGPVAMISDRRRDAPPTHPVAEFAEPGRIIAQAEQHIEMRASRRFCSGARAGVALIGPSKKRAHDKHQGPRHNTPR